MNKDITLIILLFLQCQLSYAGSIDSPASIGNLNSRFYTLTDIYKRLNNGTEGQLITGSFTEPSAGPNSTGFTLNDIMSKAPKENQSQGASPSMVLKNMKYWGLKAESWGNQIGSMPNNGSVTITPTVKEQKIQLGYHDGTGLVQGDEELISDNIKSGINIFGVKGKSQIVDTTSGDALAINIRKDKIAWVDGIEITGTLTTQTLSSDSDTLVTGTYDATRLSIIDTDLVSKNIKQDVSLFGIEGDNNVADTSTGDATASDILMSKIAWVDGVEITGSIISGNDVTGSNGSISITLPDAFYLGKVAVASDTNLIAENIKKDITIFGVSGSTHVVDTSTGDATATDIVMGKKAWVDGVELTGSVSLGNDIIGDNGQAVIIITNGFYKDNKTVTVNDSNLIAENICNGITILGVTGNKTCS